MPAICQQRTLHAASRSSAEPASRSSNENVALLKILPAAVPLLSSRSHYVCSGRFESLAVLCGFRTRFEPRTREMCHVCGEWLKPPNRCRNRISAAFLEQSMSTLGLVQLLFFALALVMTGLGLSLRLQDFLRLRTIARIAACTWCSDDSVAVGGTRSGRCLEAPASFRGRRHAASGDAREHLERISIAIYSAEMSPSMCR